MTKSVQPFTGKLLIKSDHTVLGSGFVVYCEEVVLVASCYHIVSELESPEELEYAFQLFVDGQTFELTLIAKNEAADVALFEARNNPPKKIPVPVLLSSGNPGRSNCLIQGFAQSGANYGYNLDNREVDYVSLGGTVIGVDMRDKVEWLRLETPNMFFGLSGAPIYLESRKGVIGIQSETYLGQGIKDTSWGAKIENVVELDSRLKLSADRVDKDLLESYLNWVKKEFNEIYLPAIREKKSLPKISLERVYVALKVQSKTSSYELKNAKKIIERKFKARLEALESIPSELEQQQIYEEIIQETPILRAWQEKEQGLLQAKKLYHQSGEDNKTKIITLSKAFQDERFLVILGDPGSGKSTLAKWLAIKLAASYVEEIISGNPKRIQVPVNQVDVNRKSENVLEDLGPARLPVLVRISEYSKFYEDRLAISGSTPKSLIDYLGFHLPQNDQETGRQYHQLIKDHLQKGKAVVILDGMDEVTTHRNNIIREIEKFISFWIEDRGIVGNSDLDAEELLLPPKEVGGNQLIVTSRIVGYHAAPLSGNLTHVTIEKMEENAVRHFCDVWTEQVHLKEGEGTSIPKAELIAVAKDEAKALKAAIYDDEKPLIRELATNPLLVTILALVFRHHEQTLPESRAELYDRAMSILIDKWRDTVSIHPNELRVVLAPLAAHIHTSASDDIRETELRHIIKDELSKIREGAVDFEVDEFIRQIREDVGLLAERGEKLYHFLHRTFQEYLAAQYLIGNQREIPSDEAFGQIVKNLLLRLSDPIWREPLLLALGTINNFWPPALIDKLINAILEADDPLKDLIPRSAILIATATPELTNLSPEIIKTLVVQLIRSYADKDGVAKFEAVKHQIESTLEVLHTRSNLTLNKVLENIIEESEDEALRNATFFLINEKNWWNPDWTHIAFNAINNDSIVWDCPIDDILKKHFCQKEKLFKFPLLFLRTKLSQKEVWLDRIRQDPAWIRLLTVLYGGWYPEPMVDRFLEFETMRMHLERQTGGTKEDRHQMAIVMDTQLGEMDRITHQFPVFDPEFIYRDSPFSRQILMSLNQGKTPYELKPTFVQSWQESEDTHTRVLALLGLIALGEDVSTFFSEIENVKEQKEVKELFFGHIKRIKRLVRYPLSQICIKIKESKNDSIFEKSQFQLIPLSYRKSFLALLFRVNNELALPPFNFSFNIKEKRVWQNEEAYNPDLIEYIESEYWASITSSISDDPVYNIAVLLDTLAPQLRTPLDRLLNAINKIPYSQTIHSSFNFGWEVPGYLFRPINELDKVRNAIVIIDQLKEELSFLKEWFIWSLGPYFEKYPECLPEVLAIIYSCDEKDRASQLAPEVFRAKDPIKVIFEKSMAIDSHIDRFRTVWRLFQIEPRQEYGYELMQAFFKIKNPIHVIQATGLALDQIMSVKEELMVGFAGPMVSETILSVPMSLFFRLFNQAINKVDRIQELDNRIRAICYLSTISPEEDPKQFIFQALDLIPAIEEEEIRAEALQFVLEQDNVTAQQYAHWGAITDSFSDPVWLNRALRKEHFNFFKLDEIFIDDVKANPSKNNEIIGAWGVLSLYQVFLGLEAQFKDFESEAPVTVWEMLREKSTREDAVETIFTYGKDGMTLTKEAVLAIEQLVEEGALELVDKILPLTESPDPGALPMIEKWKDHSSTQLRSFHYLIKAEKKIYSKPIIEQLIDFLLSDQDRLRCRAAIALHGTRISGNNFFRDMSTLNLGWDALFYFHQKKYQLKNPTARQTLIWGDSNIAHNDPTIIDQCINNLLTSKSLEDTEVNISILQGVEFVSKSVWERIVFYLHEVPKPILKPLLVVILKLAYLGKNTPSNWPLGAWDTLWKVLDDNLVKEVQGLGRYVFEYEQLISILQVASLQPNVSVAHIRQVFQEKSKINFLEAWIDRDKEALLKKFKKAGGTYYFNTQSMMEKALDIANLIVNSPDLLPLLFDWTFSSLEDELINSDEKLFGGELSLVCAAVASMQPDTFEGKIDKNYVEALLVEVVKTHRFWIARQSAMVMLACLKDVRQQTISALEFALKDVLYVQNQARKCFKYFKKIINERTLKQLFANLEKGSPLLAQVSVQILSEIATTDNYNDELRKATIQKITEQLRKQLKTPSQRKNIYTMEYDNFHFYQVKYLNSLDEILYKELLKISGVS